MRLVARRHRRPGLADEFALRRDRVAEKSLPIDALGRVVRTSVDAARGGKLRAKVAGVRFVGGHFLFLNLHLRGRALCAFDLRLHFFHHLERVHVDVAVGAKLGAFAATDAPIFDDDLEIFFATNGTDRALRHAKRIATRSTCGRDQKMFVTQTVAKQS